MNPDKRKTSICQYCTIAFKHGRNSTGKFCSVNCSAAHRKQTNLEKWLSGCSSGIQTLSRRLSYSVRNYLLEQIGYKCSQCGWNQINSVTQRCPLEIDHIDGNSENCSLKNLRVLCPNCHALTPTYRALNGGNGNSKRLKYSKLI